MAAGDCEAQALVEVAWPVAGFGAQEDEVGAVVECAACGRQDHRAGQAAIAMLGEGDDVVDLGDALGQVQATPGGDFAFAERGEALDSRHSLGPRALGQELAPRVRVLRVGRRAQVALARGTQAVLVDLDDLDAGVRVRVGSQDHHQQLLGPPAAAFEAPDQRLGDRLVVDHERTVAQPGRTQGPIGRRGEPHRGKHARCPLDAQQVEVPDLRQARREKHGSPAHGLDPLGLRFGDRACQGPDAPELRGGYSSSSSPSASPPARRITIWSSSIVTSTGRCPAQCSA